MNSVPNPNEGTAVAAAAQTGTAATPRLKLSSSGYAIDHTDPELANR